MAWCCRDEKRQPRGKVILAFGGSPQSCGPRVRAIAPEKEVMTGGASVYPMEGFRKRSSKVLASARGGLASAEERIAVNQCARSHVRLGREGGLAAARRRTAAISERPFVRRRASTAGTASPCSNRMILGGPCGDSYRIHMHVRAFQCSTQCNESAASRERGLD